MKQYQCKQLTLAALILGIQTILFYICRLINACNDVFVYSVYPVLLLLVMHIANIRIQISYMLCTICTAVLLNEIVIIPAIVLAYILLILVYKSKDFTIKTTIKNILYEGVYILLVSWISEKLFKYGLFYTINESTSISIKATVIVLFIFRIVTCALQNSIINYAYKLKLKQFISRVV